MEKIVLKDNKNQADNEVRKIQSFCSKVNEILPEFGKENGYQLTMEDIQELFQKRELDDLVNAVNRHIESSLTGVKITNVVRKVFTSNTEEFIYGFAERLKKINSSEIDFKTLSLKDGALVLTDESEKEVREKLVSCITTENGKQLYDLCLEAVKPISEFSQFVKQNTPLNYYITVNQLGNFFSMDPKTGEVTINKGSGFDRLTTKQNF